MPRQGAEGVPGLGGGGGGASPRDLWPRRRGAISLWKPFANSVVSWLLRSRGLQGKKPSLVRRCCDMTRSQDAGALPGSLARDTLGVLMGPVFSPL